MEEKSDTGRGITVPVAWVMGDDQKTIHANQLLISNLSGAEFYLLFGEAIPPALAELKDNDKAPTVPINVVARIAVSPKTLELIAELIEKTLHRAKEKERAASAR